jgi:hypothetical protein
MGWFHLSQGVAKWRTLMNTLINIVSTSPIRRREFNDWPNVNNTEPWSYLKLFLTLLKHTNTLLQGFF